MELLGKKRRWLSRLATAFALAALALGALWGGSARAAEEGGPADPTPRPSPQRASDGVPFVEFVNRPGNEPDLYVKKTVVSAKEGYAVPEEVKFTFTVKVDGNFYTDQVYRVFAPDGSEVFNGEDGSGGVFKTDAYGQFTLLGGQTAMFPDVGEGKDYEVTESPVTLESGQFIQSQPLGGGVMGVVEARGSTAAFENTYIPAGEETETTVLNVYKGASFPAGFTPPETPDFTFRVTVGGKPLADTQYKLVSGDTVEGDAYTDGEGRFTLKGGQTASFQDIPVGVDYKVEELLGEKAAGEEESPEDQGWRLTGSTGDQGVTTAPATLATFTNDIASFAVSKKLEGEAPAETPAFTYYLTNNDGSGIVADYYLYDSAEGTMADLGEGKEQPLTTDGSGKFTLQPGQTAVFVGVGPGTPYNIREESLKGYIQTLPTVPEGYTGKKVMGDTVETWPFVNTPSEATGTLMVTKTVDSKNPDDNSKEFKFTVRLDDLTYSGTFPQTGGHEPIVFENGVAEFTLRHGQTVYIEGLPAGMNYQVVEEEANRNGYTTAISGDVGSIPADGTVTAAFLNQVTQYIVPHTGGPGVHAAWASLAAIAAGGALLLAVRAKARRKRGGRT